jgi:hypothetical protein
LVSYKSNINSLDFTKNKSIYEEECQNLYDPEFCHRLLRIVFMMANVSQINEIAERILRNILDKNKIAILFGFLTEGCFSHKFLVIQIFKCILKTFAPLIIQTLQETELNQEPAFNSYDITSNKILNCLLNYAIHIRKKIWAFQASG